MSQKIINWVNYWWVLIPVIVIFVGVYIWYTEFISFATALLLGTVTQGLFLLTDDKFIGANTYVEIVERRNIAYALYLLSLAVVFAVGFACAFLIFITLRSPFPQ